MIFLKNYLLILIIKISNKFGRGLVLKKKTFSSQFIMERNFPENESFNFIQVGANDGISFDFLYSFVVKRKSRGVVIEPVFDYFEELQYNYKEFPEIIKINKAVHPYENEIVINKIAPNAIDKYPDWVKGVASIDVDHHLKTGIDSSDIVQERVEASTLMDILETNFDASFLDYFQVDTEGFDFEVIKMIDFGAIRPKMIKYESVNLSKEDQYKLKVLLEKNGYYLFKEFGDTVGVNLSKIKLY
ncbi:methyltransferase, FkbM family [Flavobacterium succinicans]|uniref:Methyltransferase, FkbM family n=1 Tax=Flavobacterium succinicans TaxID=29536 RepID=A0A1I4SFT7_9FLAO|nr:FkbM family methyltransferase [Flavobacterium succinicans]SFM63327.1 methyltransferase, FkbM family [Flavobacterium succinicans]